MWISQRQDQSWESCHDGPPASMPQPAINAVKSLQKCLSQVWNFLQDYWPELKEPRCSIIGNKLAWSFPQRETLSFLWWTVSMPTLPLEGDTIATLWGCSPYKHPGNKGPYKGQPGPLLIVDPWGTVSQQWQLSAAGAWALDGEKKQLSKTLLGSLGHLWYEMEVIWYHCSKLNSFGAVRLWLCRRSFLFLVMALKYLGVKGHDVCH